MDVSLTDIEHGIERQTKAMIMEETYLRDSKPDIRSARGKSRKRLEPRVADKTNKVKDEQLGYLNKRDWLLLLLFVSIPVIGWIFILHGIFSKKSTLDRKNFCTAYAIMKLIFTAISSIFMFVGYQLVIKCIEHFLQYIA